MLEFFFPRERRAVPASLSSGGGVSVWAEGLCPVEFSDNTQQLYKKFCLEDTFCTTRFPRSWLIYNCAMLQTS